MASRKQLVILDEAAAFIQALHPELKRRFKAALAEILSSPAASGKPLADELDGLRSYRIGRHRIVYRIRNRLVEIVSAGPRKSIYEETYRLLRKGRNK